MYCPRCGTDNREHAQFCEKCGFNLPVATVAPGLQPGYAPAPQGYMQQVPPPPPPLVDPRMRAPGQGADTSGRQYAEGKNPAVALILSFFLTGIGQLYNGDVKKCLLMWGICVVIIILAVITGGAAGILIMGVWIWSMIDAYNVASRKSPRW